MGLSTKSVLLVTDSPQVHESVSAAVQPVVKTFKTATTAADAIGKATNQLFDVILLRTTTPSLTDPMHLFQWTQGNKAQKGLPWIVLGKDVESDQILIQHASHVKFLSDEHDMQALLKMLDTLFVPPVRNGGKVDVNFINPLVQAAVEILRSMAQIELKRGTPFLRTPTTPPSQADVSGIIAMNSDRFLGSMAVCFDRSLILKVYRNMLGTEANEINNDVKDAVSELTNIIFGNAKRDLNAAGHTIAPAIPSVVSGPSHEVRHSLSGHCFCIPFESDHGKLLIECIVSMK